MNHEALADDARQFEGLEIGDQPIPGWWKFIFVAMILVSALYWMLHHFGAEGRTLADRYDMAVAQNAQLQFAAMGDLNTDANTIARVSRNSNLLKVGKVVFKTHCATCHGNNGEGKVGVNLTDEAYKNVTVIEDIAKVVNQGAGGNAMPAWSNKLHPNEVVLVSAYVASLRGTNAPGGKPAEGRKIAPWPEPEPVDESDVSTEGGSEPAA